MRLLVAFLFITNIIFAQQTIYDTISNGGIDRSFILYVPANYSAVTPAPLLFNFHGYTSNAYQQMFYGDFRSIADTAGFIIVHPNGTLDFNNNTHFNVWGSSSVDDVAFTEDLIDSISATYNIDLSRVYSVGMSNGGYMSYHLACLLNSKIAAVASVTGTMSYNTFNNCNPLHPTPILQIHGTLDGTVPFSGSSVGLSINAVMNYWTNYNNCSSSGVTTFLPNLVLTDGSTVTEILYDSGNCQSSTKLLRVEGGGHTWPGTNFPLVGTNYDINASLEVWKFLSVHSLNSLNCNVNNPVDFLSAPPLKIKIYPNPANNYIIVESENYIDVNYTIKSLLGQVVKSGSLKGNYTEINFSDIIPGIYIVKIQNKSFKIIKAN
ncbi:MAG: T9SS type A sorting domain-containing protein [Saprospiraceae bacterium]|nr:T9SS type A sorting domain-containing protein [Saprospiraceae bacterium]